MTWSEQAKLVGTGYTGFSEQGIAVSLSSDGNTCASGAQYNNDDIGAVWIFVRSGTTWTQQAGPLVGKKKSLFLRLNNIYLYRYWRNWFNISRICCIFNQ